MIGIFKLVLLFWLIAAVLSPAMGQTLTPTFLQDHRRLVDGDLIAIALPRDDGSWDCTVFNRENVDNFRAAVLRFLERAPAADAPIDPQWMVDNWDYVSGRGPSEPGSVEEAMCRTLAQEAAPPPAEWVSFGGWPTYTDFVDEQNRGTVVLPRAPRGLPCEPDLVATSAQTPWLEYRRFVHSGNVTLCIRRP